MIQEKHDYKNIVIAFLLILVIGLAGALVYFEFLEKEEKVIDNRKSEDSIKPTSSPKETIRPVITKTPNPTLDVTPSPSPIKTPISSISPTNDSNDEFVYSDRNYGLASYGDIIVKGYAEVKNKVLDCGVMGKCTEKEAVSVNDIVYFHITESNSEDFNKALKAWGYDKNTIKIGCLKDDMISYKTAADDYGPSEYEGKEENAYLYYSKYQLLNKDISKKITSSDSKKEITLKINKLKLSHYVSMDEQCITPITEIDIVE